MRKETIITILFFFGIISFSLAGRFAVYLNYTQHNLPVGITRIYSLEQELVFAQNILLASCGAAAVSAIWLGAFRK